MEATVRELRLHSRELLAAVDRGEEINITYRGRFRARLVPYQAPREASEKRAASNPLFGLWRDQAGPPTESVDEPVRRIRKPRHIRKSRDFD